MSNGAGLPPPPSTHLPVGSERWIVGERSLDELARKVPEAEAGEIGHRSLLHIHRKEPIGVPLRDSRRDVIDDCVLKLEEVARSVSIGAASDIGHDGRRPEREALIDGDHRLPDGRRSSHLAATRFVGWPTGR